MTITSYYCGIFACRDHGIRKQGDSLRCGTCGSSEVVYQYTRKPVAVGVKS